MKNEIVLIFTRKNDVSTELVANWISSYGYDFYRILDDYSDEMPRFEINITNSRFIYKLSDKRVIGVWLRKNPPAKKVVYEKYKDIEDHLAEEIEALKKSFYATSKLSGINTVGLNYSDESFDINKTRSLLVAKKSNLLTPNTIITNSKKELLFFIHTNKKTIVKPLSHPAFLRRGGQTLATYTSILNEEGLKNFPEKIFPCLAQEYIEKKYELRIFYFDGEIYSSAIFSQLDKKTMIDFRNYNRVTPNRVVPYNLPEPIKTSICNFMDFMGLNTGSIDMIRSDDSYYFLEVNPVGNFDMVSRPCNYQLEEKVAKKLCGIQN